MLLLISSSVHAASAELTLAQAFLAAWQRQPEAQSQVARQEAVGAQRELSSSWVPEPPSIELAHRTDRFKGNLGSREDVAALSWPLWLPGERARSRALGEAEVRADASRVRAAQLRIAAAVREAYWQWQRALAEQTLAQDRVFNTRQLAADVARRVKAGDLARADQHQAEGALAAAELGLAESASALASASQQLRTLTGAAPTSVAAAAVPSESVPDELSEAELAARHPALAELADRLERARRAADLVRVQARGNPELTVEMARERGQAGEPYQQSLTLGIRLPLGSDSRQRARVASAQAELIEAEAQWRLEQERLHAEHEGARSRLELARAQRKAADQRALLAREARGFFQKSYLLGETDLPTRLRIELEAVEAERQARRSQIELAAALSALRQAQGLLPE